MEKNWTQIYSEMEKGFDFLKFPKETRWMTENGHRKSYDIFGEPVKISAEEFYSIRYWNPKECRSCFGGYIYHGTKYVKQHK